MSERPLLFLGSRVQIDGKPWRLVAVFDEGEETQALFRDEAGAELKLPYEVAEQKVEFEQ
jgi:hypothetical protein